MSFADKLAGNIVNVALRKTAHEGKHIYPRAAEVILKNTYVDDMLDSFTSLDEVIQVIKETDMLIEPVGFKIRGWIISGILPDNKELMKQQFAQIGNNNIELFPVKSSKVLGPIWDPVTDSFRFKVKLNFSPKIRKCRTERDLLNCFNQAYCAFSSVRDI